MLVFYRDVTLPNTTREADPTHCGIVDTAIQGCHRRSSAARRLLGAALVLLALAPTGAFAYDFQKSITIDRTKIADVSCGTTLASYPMLFSVTDADLAHTTSGGDVTDLGGDDIVFVGLDATTCGGPSSCVLAHEIERYVNTSGELLAWVRVPSVNTTAAASDTVIYVQYGDSTVTSPTENPTGVWDANYQAVWHLKEAYLAAGDFKDSTLNGRHGDRRGAALN